MHHTINEDIFWKKSALLTAKSHEYLWELILDQTGEADKTKLHFSYFRFISKNSLVYTCLYFCTNFADSRLNEK